MTSDELRAAVADHERRARAMAEVYIREAAKPNPSWPHAKITADYVADVIAYAEARCKKPNEDEIAALQSAYQKLEFGAIEAHVKAAGGRLTKEGAREIIATVKTDTQSLLETWGLERRLRIWKEALDELVYLSHVGREPDGGASGSVH